MLKSADQAFHQLLSSFTDEYVDLFRLKRYSKPERGKRQLSGYGVKEPYKSERRFKRAARRAGVKKEDIDKAFAIYKILEAKEVIEIVGTVTRKNGESFTYGGGSGGREGTHLVEEIPDYVKPMTSNSGMSEFSDDLEEVGSMNDAIHKNLYIDNKYGAAKTGDGWAFFTNQNPSTRRRGIVGEIKFDVGSDKKTGHKVLEDALLNL